MENFIERIRNSEMVKKRNETISQGLNHVSRGVGEVDLTNAIPTVTYFLIAVTQNALPKIKFVTIVEGRVTTPVVVGQKVRVEIQLEVQVVVQVEVEVDVTTEVEADTVEISPRCRRSI